LLLTASTGDVITTLTRFLNECIKYRKEHQIRGMREDEDLMSLPTISEVDTVVRFSSKVAVAVAEKKEEKASGTSVIVSGTAAKQVGSIAAPLPK
jgi:hypothetical protein